MLTPGTTRRTSRPSAISFPTIRGLAFASLILILSASQDAIPQESPKTEVTPLSGDGIERISLLPPGPGNPRNSEGDFVELADGRILFVYSHFTSNGKADDGAGYLAGRYSSDGGKTWTTEDVIIVPNEGRQNVMSVSLLRLADNRIALFYARKNSASDCRPVMRISTDEAVTWSEPRMCVGDDDIGYFVINNNRAVQLKCGRLILPLALHNRPGWGEGAWVDHILCYLSDDAGLTWRRSKDERATTTVDGKHVSTQEPGVVELKDGRLLLFCRTDAGSQYVSVSSDGGDSWPPLVPSTMRSPLSPASIRRIPKTGDLMIVWNDYRDSTRQGDGPRTPLRVAVSSDDGQTWNHVKTLESDSNGHYCYTAIHFIGQDDVLLAYCASPSQEPLVRTQLTRFSLEWLYDDELKVTRSRPALTSLNDDVNGQVLMYGLGQVFQIGPNKAAASCNVRTIGTGHWDFENGTDMVLFDDLATFDQQRRIVVSRNEEDLNPVTGKKRIAVTYPIQVGFVPFAAKRPDGSVHPDAGTGFGFSQALCYDLNDQGYYTPADAKEGGQAPSARRWYVHQFASDGQTFGIAKRVTKSDADPLKSEDGVWTILAPGMSAGISDGDDILFPVLASNGTHEMTGVSRWRRESGDWRPISFHDVFPGMEPSLIRDLDGSLLFSLRGSDDEGQAVRIWRSIDGGRHWHERLHDPNLRSNAPVVLNQAADGTPYFAGNRPGTFRATLSMWPINAARTGHNKSIIVRDCAQDFGAAPSGTLWFADHPMSTNVRLADGRWHNLLSYRVIAFNTSGVGGETVTPWTGSYLEEVLSTGSPRPTWPF